MRIIFAILLLQICSSLGCISIVRVLSDTTFQNIISEGKWHVMFRYKSAYDKSLDMMIDTDVYTEFEFLDVFPYECRIEQRCLDRGVHRSVSIRAQITLRSTLNFDVYKNDTEKGQSVETYSYAVHKYEPNRLLILYNCPRNADDQLTFGLLVLHKVDTNGLRRKIELESVLEALQFDQINANETTQVSLNEDLKCPQKFLDLHFKRNAGEGNPRGNWRLALANLVLGKVLLRIYME